MYLAAICDDDISTCAQVETMIHTYGKQHHIPFQTEVFYSGETLCRYLCGGAEVTVLFLDIELPEQNGVAVGDYIRNELNDEKLDIIYISAQENYAMQLFKCRPLDFLIKPLAYEQIAGSLDIVLKRSGIKGQVFEYKADRVNHRVPYFDIVYFRSDDKKIYLVLTSGEEKVFYGKLKDVEGAVDPKAFLVIHQSYLVNYEYVQAYTYEWVKMENGDILNISKTYRKEVKQKLLQHEA